MNPMIQLKHSMLLLCELTLALLALSPTTQAQQCPNRCDSNLNTAEGDFALNSVTTGTDNTATGFDALFHNTSGNNNMATGAGALFFNTTGNNNTATGFNALVNNTTADANTANGVNALLHNTTGSGNTATGFGALASNTTASGNTANGWQALASNTTADANTATGLNALGSNTTGADNTATGELALGGNTTGKSNIALGFNAGLKLTTGNNNIDIGNVGVAGESNRIRIGTMGTQSATFIAGIHGVPVANALQVVVDVNGHLGTVGSSERFKEAIKPMDKASEVIFELKPVTFHYKKELDAERIAQFGLVAEDVEKVNCDLVVRDAESKVYTVRYDAVNAMLLNEFLKEHRKVEQLEKQVEKLTAGLQKVSTQLELNKPAPQTVLNDR